MTTLIRPLLATIAAASLVALTFVSCQSTVRYVPPQKRILQPDEWTLVVKRDQDAIWNRLMNHISGSTFSLIDLDKESGIMRASFSSSKISDFVAAGHVKSGWPVNRDWAPVVFSEEYLEHLMQSQDVWLEGEVLVQVRPVDEVHHFVQVGAQYQVHAQPNQPQGQPTNPTWQFSTNTHDAQRISGASGDSVGLRVMQPTHQVERGILAAIAQ